MGVKESGSGQYVHYVGTADEREISKSDWKAVDLTHDSVKWDKDNAFHVPVEDISAEAWPFIDADDGFKLVQESDVKKIKSKAAQLRAASEAVHPLVAAQLEAEKREAEAQAGGKGGGGAAASKTTATGGSTPGPTVPAGRGGGGGRATTTGGSTP